MVSPAMAKLPFASVSPWRTLARLSISSSHPSPRGERSAGDHSLGWMDLSVTALPHLSHVFMNESTHTERQKAGGQCAGSKRGCIQQGFFPK